MIATEALAARGIAAPGAVAEARAPRDGDPDGDSADPRTTRFRAPRPGGALVTAPARDFSPVVVHSARIVVPMTAPPILDGAVAVQSGRILHVGERSWVLDRLGASRLRWSERHWPGAILPGLVNAHSHLQYTGMASVGEGSYDGFDDWAKSFGAVYSGPHDWAAEAARGAELSIGAGVTSVADVVTDMEAASALGDAGLGGIAYWEVMDWENDAWAERGRDQIFDELTRIPADPGRRPLAARAVLARRRAAPRAARHRAAARPPPAPAPRRVGVRGRARNGAGGSSTGELGCGVGTTPGISSACRASGRSASSGSVPARRRSSTGSACSAPTATSRTAST